MSKRALGVLAGDDLPVLALRNWLESADLILAADGGADRVLAAGFVPAVVIGDLDSLEEPRESFADVRFVEDQYSTDCDKLLALAKEMGLDSITLACVEGSRPDHALATLQSAARSDLAVRLAFRRGLGWILRAGSVIETEASGKVSLLPLAHCEGVSLSGVTWPLEKVALDAMGLTSVSNQAIEGQIVKAELGSGIAFLFVEGDGQSAW